MGHHEELFLSILTLDETWTYVPLDLRTYISSRACMLQNWAYDLPLLQSSLDSPAFLLEDSLPSVRRVAPEPRPPWEESLPAPPTK